MRVNQALGALVLALAHYKSSSDVIQVTKLRKYPTIKITPLKKVNVAKESFWVKQKPV